VRKPAGGSTGLGDFFANPGTSLFRRNGTGWLCFQRIVRRAYLIVQPAFDGPVSRQQSALPVADDLAFGGVFTCLHPGFDRIGHFIRKLEAWLLSCSHKEPPAVGIGFDPFENPDVWLKWIL
jgi:hypothetical protein